MEALLLFAVLRIWKDEERGILEKLLRLAAADAVFLGALECIALVPIETDDPGPIDHRLNVYGINIQMSSCDGASARKFPDFSGLTRHSLPVTAASPPLCLFASTRFPASVSSVPRFFHPKSGPVTISMRFVTCSSYYLPFFHCYPVADL
jgi:hypothetical protein